MNDGGGATGIRRIKVSHVCPSMGEQMGGCERYAWNLAKKQAKEYDVHVYTTTRNAKRTGTFESNGVIIIQAICLGVLRKVQDDHHL